MKAQDIIARLRAFGLTQLEIARRSGMAQTTVSHLGTGLRGKRTSYETVRRLTELLSEVEAERADDVLKEAGARR
ncbi:helix-turn-helix domain-containing protein [Ralstonia sp.]|uniref:helix-turn-helix domain-containing protein n=1 Tax=unclassified Ralstonia TaxID=209769 RepID=UPI0031E076BA